MISPTTILLMSSCAHSPPEHSCEIELIVDSEIANRAPDFCAVSMAAVKNVAIFAQKNGLGKFLDRPILSKVEIVKDRARLEARLREIYNAPPETKFPSGLSAGNDAKDVLLLMLCCLCLKKRRRKNWRSRFLHLPSVQTHHIVVAKELRGHCWLLQGS